MDKKIREGECVRDIVRERERETERGEKEKKFDHAGKFNQNWLEDISL